MKMKLSKNQWEFIGKKAGWIKEAADLSPETPEPTELTESEAQKVFGFTMNDKFQEPFQWEPFDDMSYPLYVNVYKIDKLYGGPEEGGWWYDAKRLLDSEMANNNDEAKSIVMKMWEKHKDENDERDLSSVLSKGKIEIVTEQSRGESETSGKPIYE